MRFWGHLGAIALSGYLWGTAPLELALPALLVCGASLALMFCAMHECCHRTAFANPRLNDSAAWLAGLLSFYNSAFYRRYHKWHHRYPQIPGKDPKLEDPKPESLGDYLWQISGIPWWLGKVRCHGQVALGQLDDCYYIPESGRAEVVRSLRLQLLTYGAIAAVSILLGHPWFLLTYWVLPLAVGQPVLRFVLLAEHTGGILDPSRWCVVMVNMLGNGLSTSPSNCPAVTQPGVSFTHYDNVRAQFALVGSLGIEQLALVYGWSMGAQQGYHWGALYPDRVQRIAALCGTAKTTDHNKLFLYSLRESAGRPHQRPRLEWRTV